MNRYEGTLRRLRILFILINLISPLATANSLAQDPLPPPDPIVEEAPAPEPVVPEQGQEPVQPSTPGGTPPVVDALPRTGSGDAVGATGMWMILAATSLALIAGGLGIRRHGDR